MKSDYMQQKLVYLHTEKNLEQTEEILRQQGMEIILKTNRMRLSFSELTEEEQYGYLKTVIDNLEQTADQLELYDKQLEIFTKRGKSYAKAFREFCDSYKNSKNKDVIQRYIEMKKGLKKIQIVAYQLSDLRYEARDIGFDDGIRCSCIIAKMGTEIIRYLSFKHDPVLTITGPNATNLKSNLESKF